MPLKWKGASTSYTSLLARWYENRAECVEVCVVSYGDTHPIVLSSLAAIVPSSTALSGPHPGAEVAAIPAEFTHPHTNSTRLSPYHPVNSAWFSNGSYGLVVTLHYPTTKRHKLPFLDGFDPESGENPPREGLDSPPS